MATRTARPVFVVIAACVVYACPRAVLASRVIAMGQIPTDQAVQAVRNFINDPSATVGPAIYSEEEGLFGYSGPFYSFEVTNNPWAGWYSVRISDGIVFDMSRNIEGSDALATMTLDQAKAIGTSFLRQHYPPFNTGTWQMMPDRYMVLANGYGSYNLFWYRVVGKYGALAPFDLSLRVNGVTGDVFYLRAPQDLYT